VRAVEGDWRTFSSQPLTTISDARVHGDENHRMLISEDPPDHTTHRQFMGRELTPTAVRRLRPRVESIVTEILDEVIELGECDLVWDIAGKLASYVMADLLGMPRDVAVDLYDASEQMNNAPTFEEGAGRDAMLRLEKYVHGSWTDRRANPRDDVVTRLARYAAARRTNCSSR
jgi:cytochrome P450